MSCCRHVLCAVSCGRSAVRVSQVREERLAEEKIKKKAAAKKLEEAEARRRQEEEARRQRALQQVRAGARPAARPGRCKQESGGGSDPNRGRIRAAEGLRAQISLQSCAVSRQSWLSPTFLLRSWTDSY